MRGSAFPDKGALTATKPAKAGFFCHEKTNKTASVAREEAARLAGQLAVHQEQTAAILARLAPVDDQGAAQSKNKTTDKNKGA